MRDLDEVDDDMAAVGGWILIAAVVAVLAVGATMAARNQEANRAVGPPAPPATSTVSPGTGQNAPGAGNRTAAPAAVPGSAPRDANAVGLNAPPCTHLTSLHSADGRLVLEYAVSDGGSTRCLMMTGDRGDHVAAMKRALSLCAGQSIGDDGTFDDRTASVLSSVQLARGGAGDGIYGPNTSRVLGWPWRYAGSGDFTGRCSPAGVSA